MKVALNNYLGQAVKAYTCEKEVLHGGTLGQVELLSGEATLFDGKKLPYKIVHKTQKKWARFFDADSWKREFDLHESELGLSFEESMRWPQCYDQSITEDEIQIYMEYIDGISGLDLSEKMLVQAARELGRFQGKIFQQNSSPIKNISNLSKNDFAKMSYLNYRNWPEVYDYIRAKDCPIPRHLCKMLIELDERCDELWLKIEELPLVLCHRDFWVANIFYQDEQIRVIDWDTTGWGYLGEDIASLIADESDVSKMASYYEKCIPAYYQGFGESVDISQIKDNFIWEMILFQFGYRLIEAYKFAQNTKEQEMQIEILQQIFSMKSIEWQSNLEIRNQEKVF